MTEAITFAEILQTYLLSAKRMSECVCNQMLMTQQATLHMG